ncbi:bestrophin-like domain [Nocardia sp. SSK8]|uniref:bestrophin-like domain n=1 Tax=Nocardia sp. SSK8 TaxID=3120154 RepID=UPI003009D0D8
MSGMLLQLGVLALFVGAAVGIFVLGDRVRPESWRHDDDSGAGSMMLDMVNMFFAAIVAFVVVILWQQYDTAHAHTVSEGKALVSVYESTSDLPEADREKIRALVTAYTRQVVDEEWQVMDEHRRLSPATQATLDELQEAVDAVPAATVEAKANRDETATAVAGIADARFDRGLDAGYRLPGFLYLALWFATAMLMFGTVFSGVVVTRRSILMTALFGLVIGAVMVAVYHLDQPFAAGNHVAKDAYELALARFEDLAADPSSSDDSIPR